MKIWIRVYSIILLAYTGWRTYDFISSQLPKNDLNFWLSIIFLFATEIGLILWHEATLGHVTTRVQDYIAKTMTWIDFVGSLSAGIADMILRQTLVDGYVIPPALVQFLIYGLPIITAANVAAVILFENNDAERQMQRAEKELLFQAHQDAMKELSDRRNTFSDRMRRSIADNVERRATGKVTRKQIANTDTESANNEEGSANNGVKSAKNGAKSANNGYEENIRVWPAEEKVNPTIRQSAKKS